MLDKHCFKLRGTRRGNFGSGDVEKGTKCDRQERDKRWLKKKVKKNFFFGFDKRVGS